MIEVDREFMARVHALAERIYAVEGSLPVIDRGKQPEQWAAWRRWRVEHNQPVKFMDTRARFTVLTDWPPADFDELEKRYTGRKKTTRRLST